MKKKHLDPLPREFASYEEAADFWDNHDTTDYLDAFKTVEVVTELRNRYYEIEIEADVATALKAQARRKRVPISRLASDLLRQQLANFK